MTHEICPAMSRSPYIVDPPARIRWSRAVRTAHGNLCMKMRIVFVDDEVNILQAMQRSIHHMKGEWNMEFLSSAAAALDRSPVHLPM